MDLSPLMVKDIPKLRIPLTLTFLALNLCAGKSQADISRLAGVSESAVCQAIQKFEAELAPLLQADAVQRIINSQVSIIASEKVIGLINDPLSVWSKKDILTLSTVSGIHQDKNQKATQVNIQINTGSVIVADIFKSLFPKSGSKQVEPEVIEVASGSEPGNIPPLLIEGKEDT